MKIYSYFFIVFSFFFLFFSSYSKLALFTAPHRQPNEWEIFLFGEYHCGKFGKNTINDLDVYHEDTEGHDKIIESLTAYKSDKPVHILIEALETNLSEIKQAQSNTYGASKFSFLSRLRNRLNAVKKENWIVENFDYRSVQRLASICFDRKQDDEDYIRCFFLRDRCKAVDFVRFQDLYDEMDECIDKTRKFAQDFLAEYASTIISQLEPLQKQFEEFKMELSEKFSIQSDFLLVETACNLHYSTTKYDDKTLLFDKFNEIVDKISDDLLDIVLFSKIIAAYKSQKRVIVFAGNAHIRGVGELLQQIGFCNKQKVDLLRGCFFTNSSISSCDYCLQLIGKEIDFTCNRQCSLQ